LRDLVIEYPSGKAISVEQPTTMERVTIRAYRGMGVGSALTARDIVVETTSDGINLGGSLTLDGGVIRNGTTGIVAVAGSSINATNLLIQNVSGVPVDLTNSQGSIEFATIAHSGRSSTVTSGIACNPNSGGVVVRSSIIWSPGATMPPITGMCSLVATIAGPTAVAGATSVDPKFVDPGAGDFHLAANSPAIDVADTGPSRDFEAQARPQGARFDLGADEAR
jgi:hypothetical protein